MKKRLGFSPDKAGALMLTFKVAAFNPVKRAPINYRTFQTLTGMR